MMKIALLGSTGFVGKVLMQKALNARYEIKTLVRSPEKLAEYRDRVEYVKGNMFDTTAILAAITGTEAVLSTIGPPQQNPGDPHLYEKAMGDLVTAMKSLGIMRIIHIGGAAHSGGENENWNLSRRFLRVFLTLAARPVLEAKLLEWEVLKKSNLEWTLVRPPRIIRSTTKGTLYADEKNLSSITVNVDDLADFMLEQIASREWIGKAPLVASSRR
jgi:putative NADH-flavin reductase